MLKLPTVLLPCTHPLSCASLCLSFSHSIPSPPQNTHTSSPVGLLHPPTPGAVVAGSSDFSKVDVLIANPLRLKVLEEQGKVDLSKVRVCCVVLCCV